MCRRENRAKKLANILGFKIGRFSLEYLGLPFSNITLTKNEWIGIIKVQRKIDGRQAKLLSREGRLTLVIRSWPIDHYTIFQFLRRLNR